MPGAAEGRGSCLGSVAALGLGAVLGGLAACSTLPGLIPDALPERDGWTSLPLGSWVVEGGITPDSIVACWDAACPARFAVGRFRATGREAHLLAAALADPAAFERGLARVAAERRLRRRDRRNLASSVRAAPWRSGPSRGLRVTFARDGGGRVAHGLVLARREGDALIATIVVGESAESVAQAAEGASRPGL